MVAAKDSRQALLLQLLRRQLLWDRFNLREKEGYSALVELYFILRFVFSLK